MAATTTATLEFMKEAYGNKLKTTKNNVTLQLEKGESVTGSISIAKHLQREVTDGLSLEDRMSVEQWLDFSGEIASIEKVGDRDRIQVVLKDLNSFIKDRVFFVGSSITVADVFLYHCLFPIFVKLSFQEKEKLVHLSRWFNNIQNDVKARQSLLPVKFLRTMLYSGVGNH